MEFLALDGNAEILIHYVLLMGTLQDMVVKTILWMVWNRRAYLTNVSTNDLVVQEALLKTLKKQ